MTKTPKPISPFRLSSLLRLEKDPKLALKLFQNPNPSEANPGKPFRRSLLSYDLIISKLGRAKMFDELEQVLHQLKLDNRLVPREIIFCNVIGFYARASLPQRALQTFDEMPSFRCQRTVKSVNSLLNALLKCGEFDEMMKFFEGMEEYAKPDACTYNILIRGCCSRACLDEARRMFDVMQRNGLKPDVVTFGTLIYGFCINLKVKEALKLKDNMLKVYGVQPNGHVYTTLITGLCKLGELSLAFRFKEEMVKNGMKLDSTIYSTLISELFKVGKKEEIFELLKEMTENGCKPDTVTYNVMINGFCKESDFEAAYKVLDEMAEKQCKPDVISYNVILSGLCKTGKWNEAQDMMEDMPRQGCAPDVVSYRIVFDGLCEAMQFNEAAFILDEMIFKGYKPRSATLHKFVQGLCQDGNLELLGTVLSSLEKGNAIDADLWGMAVSTICTENDILRVSHLFDTFIMP